MKIILIAVLIMISSVLNAQVYKVKSTCYVDKDNVIPATELPITSLGFFTEGIAIQGGFGTRHINASEISVVRSIGVKEWEGPNIWFMVYRGKEMDLEIMVTKGKYGEPIPIRALLIPHDKFITVMEF